MPTLAPKLPYTHPFAGGYPGRGSQRLPSDPDALAYLAAVAAADGAAVETAVAVAVDDFIRGCKADGIWDAIKASCILCGARTLAGALVPLVGAAPTNNNFVSGDYSRDGGLTGNGTTKYLNTNRAANAEPQNDHHLSMYQTAFSSGIAGSVESRYTANAASFDRIVTAVVSSVQSVFANSRNGNAGSLSHTATAGLVGVARSTGSSYTVHRNGGSAPGSATGNTSYTPSSDNYFVFARNPGGGNTPTIFAGGSICWYSIGESLDLALLDARVSALVTAIGAAI